MLSTNGRKLALILLVVLTVSYTIASAGLLGSTHFAGNPIEEQDSYINHIETLSMRYEHPYAGSEVKNSLGLEGYDKLLENDRLQIWYRKKIFGIRIVDKITGYVWGGLKEDKPENMNTRWSGIGNSLLGMDYFDKEGLEKTTGLNPKDTEVTYAVNGSVATFDVKYKELDISLSFSMELKEKSLLFSMDNGNIHENGTFSIARVYFIPFLGAVQSKDGVEGYVFLPDGPGALMRFGKNASYLVSYDKRIYGIDYGIDNLFQASDLKANRPNDFATDEKTVHMPVLGMVHGIGQNAWFARIVDGQAYATINAVPGGMQTDYTWATAKFIFRQKYSQPISRSGAGIQVVQKKPNDCNPAIEYYFLSGEDANYSGMARLYRDLLIKEGSLVQGSGTAVSEADQNVPLQVDFILSEIEKGLFFNKKLEITSQTKIKEAIDFLNSQGITSLDVVLKGWQKGGLDGYSKEDVSLKNSMGSLDHFKDFIQALTEKTENVYLYNDPVTAKELQINTRQDSSISISQSSVKQIRENKSIWLNETYFIKPQNVADRIVRFADLLANNGIEGMALKNAASSLYAENLKDKVLSREQALSLMTDTLNKAAGKTGTALYDSNEYAWKYADRIYDVPMVNSQYLFETDTVPYMQMVLKGSVDYFAPYTNISFFTRSDLLKHIEYGAYPAFLLTGISNAELKDTPISEYSSTCYEDWKDTMVSYYNEINAILGKVEGRKMENRTVLAEGVVRVDYDGGRSIIVNYTSESFVTDGVTVDPRSAVVTEVGVK